MWRSTLLRLSGNRGVQAFATRNFLARRVARRFVAGESLDDALAVARKLNSLGAGVELDYLGENVAKRSQAEAAARAYLEALDRCAAAKADAHVSLKVTQMGLDLDLDLCLRNVERVVRRAEELGTFVWLDMESSAYTDRTLAIYRKLRAAHAGVGVAIQAYLYRSKRDVADLLSTGGTVRLCKGAYMEPAGVAFQDKRDVDRSFVLLSEMLLSSRTYQAIATHDEKMIRFAARFAKLNQVDRQSFEFQMLYGVRRDLQARLLREGYRTRIYVPYGSEWYPYFMRRLAERPANLVFLLSNLLREAQVPVVDRDHREGDSPRRAA